MAVFRAPIYFINLWLISYRHRYCTYLYYYPFLRPGLSILPTSRPRTGSGYIWWETWHVISQLARSHHVNVLLRQLHTSKADALLTKILQTYRHGGLEPVTFGDPRLPHVPARVNTYAFSPWREIHDLSKLLNLPAATLGTWKHSGDSSVWMFRCQENHGSLPGIELCQPYIDPLIYALQRGQGARSRPDADFLFWLPPLVSLLMAKGWGHPVTRLSWTAPDLALRRPEDGLSRWLPDRTACYLS